MGKKRLYDFIVAIPGYQPIGIKSTSAVAAHKTVMTALKRKFPDRPYVKFDLCNVSTQNEKYIHAKSLTSISLRNDNPGIICNESSNLTNLLGQGLTSEG